MNEDEVRINQQLMEIEQEINEELERVVAGHQAAAAAAAADAAAGRDRGGGEDDDHDNDDEDDDHDNDVDFNEEDADDDDDDEEEVDDEDDASDDDDDDDDVDREDDEDEDDIAMDADEDDDVIDGGDATGKGSEQAASSCNMFVLIECVEKFGYEDHPIYQPGVTVSIGLDKTTRLSAVFNRYVQFANESFGDNNSKPLIEASDLEFIHCSVLQPSDTAETAALMKNDRIKVHRVREKERRAKAEWVKSQRDSDRDYFSQMRHLQPDFNLSFLKCDVVFHCRGRMKDDKGYKQEVLTTFVKGHCALLCSRSDWLSRQISNARAAAKASAAEAAAVAAACNRRGNNIINEEDDGIVIHPNNRHRVMRIGMLNLNNNGNGNNGNAVQILDNDGDDNDNDIPNRNPPMPRGAENIPIANAVEVDDDEDDDNDRGININLRNHGINENGGDGHRNDGIQVHNIQDVSADEDSSSQAAVVDSSGSGDNGSSPRSIPYVGGNFPNTLRVPLSHPPEAVKLLLEYCYTNRVVPLGQSAFVKSYKPTDLAQIDASLVPHTGPVSPFPHNAPGMRCSWPNNGFPTVNLQVAMAGIQLAEEASLPRFSLMCEIAASQLVTDTTALEALALCEQQFRDSGNGLKHLRKIVMQSILGRGISGIRDLSSIPSFKRTLNERRDVVVPSMMKGLMETVNDVLGEKRKVDDHNYCHDVLMSRKRSTSNRLMKLDEDDNIIRNRERLQRRKERWGPRPRWNEQLKNPYGLQDELDFAGGSGRGSLMRHVLDMNALDSGKPFIVQTFADIPGDIPKHKSSRHRLGRRGKYSGGSSGRPSKGRKRR